MPLVYKARENDIIEDRAGLEQAIVNNLSIFFDVFQQKLIFDIKLVSSITTQDGSQIRGETHQVKTGTNAHGQAKFKTVVNKFAVMDIYEVLPGQSRKKLTRLAIAPVNILKYKPTTEDLQTQSNSVGVLIKAGGILPEQAKQDTATQNKKPSETTEQSTPTVPQNPQQNTPLPANKTWYFYFGGSATKNIKYYRGPFDTEAQAWAQVSDVVEKYPSNLPEAIAYGTTQVKPTFALDPKFGTASAPATTSAVSGGNTGSSKPGATAATLFEWYQAQGQTLPSVSERAKRYEGFGLGPAGTYAGTSEQNNKLLSALKS